MNRPARFSDLRATIVGGLFAGLVLPVALVGAVLLEDGFSSGPERDLLELGVFAALGSIVGFVMAISIGFPALIVLRGLKQDRPWMLGVAGALLGLAFGFAFLSSAPISIFIVVAVVGCACGLVTGGLRRKATAVERPGR